MWPALLVGIVAASVYAYERGRRRNRAIDAATVAVLERELSPTKKHYVATDTGVARRFEFASESRFPIVRGMLTLLPRYAFLYLPIARALRRRDLLTITFLSENLPVGNGHIVSARALSDGWHFARDIDEMHPYETADGAAAATVFCYNRTVAERLRSVATEAIAIPGFRSLSCSHDPRSITIAFEPKIATIGESVRGAIAAADRLAEEGEAWRER